LGDPLLGAGLFRGTHPLGMSPRIHQVLRANSVKYFIGETLRADRASESAVAESTVSDSKLYVGTGFRCTLLARESQAGTPGENKDTAKFELSLRVSSRRRIQPRLAADSKLEDTCWAKLAFGMEGPAFLF
jgi:hypothetical protein